MSKDFRSGVRELAVRFAEQLADEIVNIVQASSMADVFGRSAPTGTPSFATAATAPSRRGRRGRGRTRAVDTGATLTTIVDLLSKNAGGLRAEQIRDTLKLDKLTVTKALTAGLEAKTLTKKGEKRATTYFAK